MEGLGLTSFWNGKRVLITGHTGFKGSWLAHWLKALGSEVFGVALEPDTTPDLFSQLGLSRGINHTIGDVRDPVALRARIDEVQPDVIFHLAAQALVRRSYQEPLLTWDVNVMGVANLLDATRALSKICACIIVTTDKVYQNLEWHYPYRETDALGGHDPYSASKAAAELVTASFRSAFFGNASPVRIATARAGNVIGGGDWSKDRLIPDLIRALAAGNTLEVRNPNAVRPWQHVLEPLSGYLRLAERLHRSEDNSLRSAYNFGPQPEDARNVREVIELVLKRWDGRWRDASDDASPHEARLLSLTIDKAKAELDWTPRWTLDESITMTVDWYREVMAGGDAGELTSRQITVFGDP